LEERGCAEGASGRTAANLRWVSLFDGAVTSTTVELRLGAESTASIGGLLIDGTPLDPVPGDRIPLQTWGTLLVEPRAPVRLPDGRGVVAALAVHLRKAHGGLPAGATVLVALAGLQQHGAAPSMPQTAMPLAQSKLQRGRPRKHEPLVVTP